MTSKTPKKSTAATWVSIKISAKPKAAAGGPSSLSSNYLTSYPPTPPGVSTLPAKIPAKKSTGMVHRDLDSTPTLKRECMSCLMQTLIFKEKEELLLHQTVQLQEGHIIITG